ncbi:hypothetical protein TH61_14305 [Rufibacter sp. DG15C]|uniref:hypothetical protein n=1 Tax=Rufibacter sp. DG15C TaxID=1379909 RepID=UPI00078C2404|nr:hypothetical protein [Rufibacter sp. DG15C]AMM52125.1 hypothetical protein TH61_14305 [Rufibacter sp. DG15C]
MEVRNVFVLIVLTLLAVAGLVFIHQSNDHLECETQVENYTNAEGGEVTTKTHICKERFAI